ncbi:SCO family protein [Pseudomonas sp. BN102]|uniref:SCO family protein n=1 Tax=Pseudomonas sp. BN102 TaxID=2567886 RepID=UPI00245464B6|nr:SCO family protein [Pseudomonas sp. BN102]MDH4611160.1 SCO family protein [Pseudomonas sp. BN102]
MNTRRNLVTGMGVAALGLIAIPGLTAGPARSRSIPAGDGYFPNTQLFTHEGRAVRFYDDLIRGKVVAINMMYVSCAGRCPIATANLLRVQKMLGERAGRDVFMYSITLQPELDTPQQLKAFVDRHHVGPGWLFLTGAPEDIEQLRFSLGFYDVNPEVDANLANHSGMVRIGNDVYQRWTMAPALAEPEQILSTINHVDSRAVHTA